MLKNHLIINDPVYGFIRVTSEVLRCIIDHPYFQRLGRIRQLGMSSFVYPGALHTRKEHSLGTMHLMQTAIKCLQEKGETLSDLDIEAASAAALMHDLGHCPFSHILEGALICNCHHENISMLLMEKLNKHLDGRLSNAIDIYSGKHPRKFLHELVCSQLDVDRLDYLCRDSYYTGVREGSIGAERLIRILYVDHDELLVEEKGVHSVENYLMARRLMYWQVYLHKTSVAGEFMLRNVMNRAKYLLRNGQHLFASDSLKFFLDKDVDFECLKNDEFALSQFLYLDDNDIFCALKAWMNHPDPILSSLSRGLIDRRLLKVKILDRQPMDEELQLLRKNISASYNISEEDANSFVGYMKVRKEMYSDSSEGIKILHRNGYISQLSDVSYLVLGEKTIREDQKVYFFYPKS